MHLSYAVVRWPVHPRGAPSASPHKAEVWSGWPQARRWPCGQESHATWGWGRAAPKARQAVAEECQGPPPPLP